MPQFGSDLHRTEALGRLQNFTADLCDKNTTVEGYFGLYVKLMIS